MGRRKTQFLKGQYYHIYNRGVNKENIFREAKNYLFFLRKFKDNTKQFFISVIAYCLMPNHYHFLLRQDSDISISDFMQAIFNSYSKAFNKMYQRSGTLFEGPFKSILVDSDEYLVHLCRYIHRNPIDTLYVPRTSKVRGTSVHKPLVENITDWQYSNYLEWIGTRDGVLMDQEFIKKYFPDKLSYQRFVLDYTPSKQLIKKLEPYLLD